MRPAKLLVVRLFLAGSMLLLPAGCVQHHAVPAPLLSENATKVSVRHFLGTPLSGTVMKQPGAFSPVDALAVEVSFIALEQNPEGFDALGARARLIVASHGANPVRSTGALTSSATYVLGDDAVRLVHRIETGGFQRRVPLGNAEGALPAGVTARFEVTDSGKAEALLPSGLGHRRFQVQISRPEKFLFTRNKNPATAPTTEPDAEPTLGATTEPSTRPTTVPASRPATKPATQPVKSSTAIELQLAVELDDIAAPEVPGSAESTDVKAPTILASAPKILHIETVLLDPVMLEPDAPTDLRPTAVIAAPFTFRDGRNKSVAAIIRISRGTNADARHRSACALAAKDMAASYAAALADAATRPAPSPDEATVNDLLASISHPATRRPAAEYLAAWAGARYCEDAVLSADDKTLADLTAQFSAEIASVAREKPTVGWRLDRTTLRFLAKLQADDKLPPELAAILSDRAGEAGRHASAMEEILRDVAGPVDLDQRLVATNRLYLEDSSPASRARAYDWLKNRNRHEEPAGYIPLSPARERRAALDKDLVERAAAATRPSTQPTGVP